MYRQFYPALFALCKTFFDDNQEIVTAINNGMLKVFKNIEQYDEEKGTFFNWVYTVVRNAALTEIRNKKTSVSLAYIGTIPDTAFFKENSIPVEVPRPALKYLAVVTVFCVNATGWIMRSE